MLLLNQCDAVAFIFARRDCWQNIDSLGVPLCMGDTCSCSAGDRRVIVSTDSEEIAAVAIQYGAEVPFLRPSY